jgi:hypothetical protein
MAGLTSCADTSLRTGINPVLDVVSVQNAASNQTAIINALVLDAGYDPQGSVNYYEVAQAGFNYVDDQCTAYFDYMFFFDRRRNEIQSGLAAAGATTGAILGLTSASAMSLGIVASAFGFASNATDIVAGTYVFSHPAETMVLVHRLQTAFRNGAATNRAFINSRTSAYYAIQRYLSLCLPPTIEGVIANQISATTAVSVPTGEGSLVSVQTGTSLPTRPAPPHANRQAGSGVTAQASHRPQPQETVVKPNRGTESVPVPPEMSQFFLAYNPAQDTPSYVTDVLQKLCAPDFPKTAQDRPEWVKKVKALVRIYENTPQFDVNEAKPVKDGKIDETEGRTILASVACGPQVRNYFEKKTFDTNNLPDTGFITDLYKVFGKPIPNEISLDKLRQDISEANKKLLGISENDFLSDQITPELETKLSQVNK